MSECEREIEGECESESESERRSARVRVRVRVRVLEALWKQGRNDQQQGGVRSDAAVVERGPVAFSGCLGLCAAAHNLHAMECPREELVRLGPAFGRMASFSSF